MSKKGNSSQSNRAKVIGLIIAAVLMAGFVFIPIEVMVYVCFAITIPLLLLKINSDAKKRRNK